MSSSSSLPQNEAGLAGAPAKAVSAVKEMNIPQKIKDINIKLPDMPSLGNLKFLNWWRFINSLLIFGEQKKKKLVSLYNSNKFVETETESCLSFSSILPNYRSVLVTLTRESLKFGRILDFRNIMYVGFRLRTFGILKKDPTFNFCSRGYHNPFFPRAFFEFLPFFRIKD